MNAGLIEDLASNAGFGGLVEFEYAAGKFPSAVVRPVDRQQSAVLYGVSGGTIRKAMVKVRASGLVETRHGKGSIVKDRPPVRHRSSDRFWRSLRQGSKAAHLAESAQSGATGKVSVFYIGPTEAPEDAAERLGVPTDTQVLARRRLHFRNGTPVETAMSYLPWDVVKDIPALFAENPGGGGIYTRLEDHAARVRGVRRDSARLASLQGGVLGAGTQPLRPGHPPDP